MATVKLSCPQCGQHYSVEIDPALNYEDMTCQQCGGKIPVSAEPPPSPAPPAEPDVLFKPGDRTDDNPRLKCPWCQNIFTPPFDLKEHVGGCDCPACGKGMYWPLEQYLVNKKPESSTEKKPTEENKSSPPPAATFFFAFSIINFVAGDVAAIFDNPPLANSLYWSGVSFILMAIYLKIQWK